MEEEEEVESSEKISVADNESAPSESELSQFVEIGNWVEGGENEKLRGGDVVK